MYELKILLPQFDIELPTCMYKLQNTCLRLPADIISGDAEAFSSLSSRINHQKCNDSMKVVTSLRAMEAGVCALDLDILGSQIQQMLKSSNDATVVAHRQNRVLQQLEELKNHMANIRDSLNICNKSVEYVTKSSQSKHNNVDLHEETLHDIVINGHPDFIPYALLALKNAWQELFTINVQTFTHSTMTNIGPAAEEFERRLKTVPLNNSKPKINVTLIWKNCEHTEMISSPTMYVPIYGEVNIIRYMGRVGPIEYRYENSPLCNEIDAILDICYQLLRCNTTKGKATLIYALSDRLQGWKYFGGDELSIADIGVHSCLIRLPSLTAKELTPKLVEWQKRIKLVTKI